MAISGFNGNYRFLSNFWYAEVGLDGVTYPSVEHAYQAAKTTDPKLRRQFETGTSLEAKRNGKRLPLRKDWEQVKLGIMEKLLRQKFRDNKLGRQLANTRSEPLIEENYWNDTYWGVCRGKGQNHLGRLLMKIRDELQTNFSNKDDADAQYDDYLGLIDPADY